MTKNQLGGPYGGEVVLWTYFKYKTHTHIYIYIFIYLFMYVFIYLLIYYDLFIYL